MQEQRQRIPDGSHIPGGAAEGGAALRRERYAEHDELDDAQDVRVAEAAVLEDAEAREAGDDRAPEERGTGPARRRYFLVARKRNETGEHRDQADGGVNRTERRQT